MNNDMKCPFCQQKLESFFVENRSVFACCNLNCKGYFMNAPKELWQALIDTKKKLDIAMDGLKRIEKLTEPSYKNRNLEALALAVNTFSGEIIEQINQWNNNE